MPSPCIPLRRLAILGLSLLIALAVLTASASARPAQHSFPYGQCTYWAYLKRPFVVDQTILETGASNWNGGYWALNAQVAGFKVGDRPAVGALAVWGPGEEGAGKDGHIAYVEKVLGGGDYQISEMNWQDIPKVHYRIVSPDPFVRFIYRSANEVAPHGHGTLTELSSISNSSKLTFALSGRATLLIKTTGPGIPANGHELVRTLPGTTTISLATLAGEALQPGAYTTRALVVGGGGGYTWLTTTVTS